MLGIQPSAMKFLSISFAIVAVLINTHFVSVQADFSRVRLNLFDPVLSANAYTGHVKETESIVQIEPRLYASDADPSNSVNGKICGYELSLHKHDDILDDITKTIPFTVEIVNNQPILKLKSQAEKLDCETKQNHRLYIRAFDCAPSDKRRYSERSSLVITVDDVNEYVPVFTHDHYLFKLHESQNCDASSCRIEATDDDCANEDHRVCGYEITTPNVPFSIDSNGIISITRSLNKDQYEFDVIAIDCFPSNNNARKISEPARVTFKIIKSCKPAITDKAGSQISIQSDRIHLFDTVNVDTCAETCNVQDIVGTVELDANGLDSGCNVEQCSTIQREYVLLPKDDNPTAIPKNNIMSFNGYSHALAVNHSTFSGHFDDEFTIRMWMKHANDGKNNDKEHIFCKSDRKLKNRHHTALFIQNNNLKLLIRKGPLSSNTNTMFAAEWIWKLPQINDNQWHSYRFDVAYPNKVDLYVDGNLFITTKDNFRVVNDHPLTIIPGTDDTDFILGACWHARASRTVQLFHGHLSGLTIQQKEELQRSSDCIRDCHQYLDVAGVQTKPDVEFVSNSNRSTWILRTDSTESYENLLKHVVYRNTFEPIGPYGQRKVAIRTRVRCLGERNTYDLPTFTRHISIDQPQIPVRIELKGDTNYVVPEEVMNQGIYLFRTLSIYTNALKKSQGDIGDCTLKATPALSNTEQLIIPDDANLNTQASKEGALVLGPGSIDDYQYFLRQIAYISHSPVTYTDRSFSLSCTGVNDQVFTNEIAVRVRIEKQMAPSAPVAAAMSNKLVVDNDYMRDNTVDLDARNGRTARSTASKTLWLLIVSRLIMC